MYALLVVGLCVLFYFVGLKIGTANERLRQDLKRRHEPNVIDLSKRRWL